MSVIKKEWNNATCSNVNEPGGYHTKWSKSEKDKRYHLYVKSKKMIENLYTKQKQTYRLDLENKFMVTRGKDGGERQIETLGLTCIHCYA